MTPKRIARSLGASEVLDALAYRSVVEPGAAELAASRRLDVADEGAPPRVARRRHGLRPAMRRVCDSRYHLLIAELSGSPTLAAAVAEVQGRLDGLLGAIPVFARNIAHSDPQHARIAKADHCADGRRPPAR